MDRPGGQSSASRTVQIRVGEDTVTAEGPLPPGLRDALAQFS